jgi:hypothetical protein
MSLNLTISSNNLFSNGVQVNTIFVERPFVYANPGSGEYLQLHENTIYTVGVNGSGVPLQVPADAAMIALQPPGLQCSMYVDNGAFARINSQELI